MINIFWSLLDNIWEIIAELNDRNMCSVLEINVMPFLDEIQPYVPKYLFMRIIQFPFLF